MKLRGSIAVKLGGDDETLSVISSPTTVLRTASTSFQAMQRTYGRQTFSKHSIKLSTDCAYLRSFLEAANEIQETSSGKGDEEKKAKRGPNPLLGIFF